MAETHTPPQESFVDVLVIGAGPAGLFAANGLAKNGVNVRIVDKRSTGVAAGQADGLAARTMEVLQSYGLLDSVLKQGLELHMMASYESGPSGIERVRRGATYDISNSSSIRWQAASLNQGAIERIFLNSLKSMDVPVERPVVPLSIELSTDQATLENPHAYPAKVELSHLDERGLREIRAETVYAKFVIGADGARSWVRKAMDITFDGESTQYVWGAMDFLPNTDFPDIRCIATIQSTNGSLLLIPREDDLIRLYVHIDEHADLIDEDGRLRNHELVTPERLLNIARERLVPYTIEMVGEPKWSTAYIISQRVASKFSVRERVFIVGDACHTHSPKAGQGMNASMNDSHNLLWKLTHVLRGWSKIPLLKTYEAERRKFAQDLIAFDKKLATIMSSKVGSSGEVLSTELAKVWKTFGSFASGVGIHYLPSEIVDPTHQACAPKLTVGQRIPPTDLVRAADAHPENIHDLLPADGRFKLLIFAGDIREVSQIGKLRAFADGIHRNSAFAKVIGGGKRTEWLDIISVCQTPLLDVVYTDIPTALRSHWSKVYVDDLDLLHRSGGNAYKEYGIGSHGAVVVVRPDGYIGTMAPLDEPIVLDGYFRQAGFMS